MKPCPHCGSKDVKYYTGWRGGSRRKDKSEYREPAVCCGGCGCGFYPGLFSRAIPDYEAKRITLEGWNRRTGAKT
jgi:hypothetical protein